jgi:hypothetical protein
MVLSHANTQYLTAPTDPINTPSITDVLPVQKESALDAVSA